MQKGSANYVIRLPSEALKFFPAILPKACIEKDYTGAAYGEEWTQPTEGRNPEVDNSCEDEDGPLFPVQRRQLAQVITEFPDVFSLVPGTAKGCEHKTITPPGRVIRTPI